LDNIQMSEAQFNAQMSDEYRACDGKVVEIDGVKYKLTPI
jgi:hypothetical protein